MFNYAAMPGMVPNPTAIPATRNWLTKEKYEMLQKGNSQFRLSVSDEELTRGQCNHFNLETGQCLLVPDNDGSGSCTCSVCGTKFTPDDFSAEEVIDATKKILDILNTIKIMYISIDKNAALDYFQIYPFIEKIPQLYNIAVNDFKKYEGVNSFIPGQVQNPANLFNMIMNPAMYQQPMYQQPVMNPAMYQQPMMAGYGAQPGYNPMYGAPSAQPQYAQPGYVPQTQGYTMNPAGAAAPQMMNTNMPVQPGTSIPMAQMMNTNMPVQPGTSIPTASQAPATEEVKVDTQFKK